MEEPTYLEVPSNAPTAYWEGWAEIADPMEGVLSSGPLVLRTFRTGTTGASDAQYIVDRLASGLHFGRVL